MYSKTLYPETKQVLESLKDNVRDFYLAGGTGLALQLGHRKSADLDFFIQTFPKRDILLENLKPNKVKILQEAPGTLDTLIDGVKVSFLEYKYPLLSDFEHFEGIKVANIIDIACMKLSAISSRGSKKDFVDLYFILKKYSLKELFDSFEKKFAGVEYQKLHLLKSMTYFSEAEKEPSPIIIKPIEWDEIKETIKEEVKNYLSRIKI